MTLWGSAASTAAAAAAAAAGAARRGGLSGENAEGCGREVTDYGGGVVGDPRRLVALVKLVAATEGALRMSGSGGGGGFGGEEGGLIYPPPSVPFREKRWVEGGREGEERGKKRGAV